MSAERHFPDENNEGFTSRLSSLPVSTHAATETETSHLNNTEVEAYTSATFFLHQQINFFPHNGPAVSKYDECLLRKKKGK